MTDFSIQQIQIDRQDLSKVKLVTSNVVSSNLKNNQVLLETESFGFSANNITYAALGKQMGYWGFFPVDDKFGIVPVWGFAKVVASNNDAIEVGRRVYGYLPLASHLLVQADKVNEASFVDTHPARKSISPVYDNYLFVDKDPAYNPNREVWQANFRPLFMTSFVLADYVQEFVRTKTEKYTVLLTSASSKTALGTAHLLRSANARYYRVVGLCSEKNLELTNSLACYDEVWTYKDITNIDNNSPCYILDFASNGDYISRISRHLAGNLEKISLIGATDWSAKDKPSMNGENTSIFFAPDQVKKLITEKGQQQFLHAYACAWQSFVQTAQKFMRSEQVIGSENIIQVYLNTLQGNSDTRCLYDLRFKL